MKLSELILAVGDENVGIQNLDVCADTLDSVVALDPCAAPVAKPR
jgi:hypothetical protein